MSHANQANGATSPGRNKPAVHAPPVPDAAGRWADCENEIVRWTEMERGGHFAALEAPDFFVADVRAFFRALRTKAAART